MSSQSENGWIEWTGGECPVPGNTLVHVRTRRREYSDESMRADGFLVSRWEHAPSMPQLGHIIAYRIVEQSK